MSGYNSSGYDAGTSSSAGHPSGSTANKTSQHQKASFGQLRDAAAAVGLSLKNEVYALVGGAACALLGSERQTEDVDIVVPQGTTKDARKLLRNQPDSFEVEPRTLHTYFRSNPRVEIEIIAPPSLFKEPFDRNTPVVMVDGIKVLKPSLILNAKCNSVLGRASLEKKESDASDIKFCLGWSATNGHPTAAEVPRANKEFVEWFVSTYGDKHLWSNAGYNWNTWSF